MALANDLGLTHKVVSERHFLASQTELTAGEAAKLITKAVGIKVLAKDLKILYELQFKDEMEWHHSGFFSGTSKRTMGRTYFISPKDTQVIIDNFSTLYPSLKDSKAKADENVYAFYWEWFNCGSKRRQRWSKRLSVYTGKRTNLPKNSTECDIYVYQAAKMAEGRIYSGWDEPTISEFMNQANMIKKQK